MKHVVVLGAGFGGVRVVRGLRNAPVRLTVIDANNFHTFQPLLYQVATSGLEAGDISFPIRTLLRRNRNSRFVLGTVERVDLDARCVTLGDGRRIDYDFLVIALGTVTTTFGIPGVDEHALPLKTLHDAVALRAHLLASLEHASSTPEIERLAVVVVGGGPTGVEMAGALRELLDRVLRKDFPELDVAAIPITLVEAAPRVLGPFAESLSQRATATLQRHGVRVIEGTGVERVEAEQVVLASGEILPASTIVWAAGVTAHPLAKSLGVQLGRGGRIVVEPNLAIPGHGEVFAIGDIALPPGDQLHQVAQPAIQGGVHVADEIIRSVHGEASQPFRYRDKGSMATIGRNQAIAEFPNGWKFHGRLGWAMWLGLHLLYLIGWRNRATTLVNWAWNYLTYDRSARTML